MNIKYILLIVVLICSSMRPLSAKKILTPTLNTGGPGGSVGSTGVAGSTMASYSVNSGNFNYSIPILVSPGVNGLEPSLGIVYSHNNYTSLLGAKFSMTGLNAIVRGGKNLYEDGKYEPIKWEDTDNFFLNGIKLMVYANNSPASIEYRLKNSNRIKVVAYNISSHGPEYFEVTDEQGTISGFGKTEISRKQAYVYPNNPTYAWYINQVTDVYGNTIKYNYASDYTTSGNLKYNIANFRPTSIYYGTATSQLGYVVFEYENSVETTNYIAGNKFVTNKRLKNISSGYNGQQLRRYYLQYNTLGGKDILNKVTEYGTDNATHYNSNVFDYNSYSTSALYNTFNLPDVSVSSAFVTGDFNGDGKSDVITNTKLVLSTENDTYIQVASSVPVNGYKEAYAYDLNYDGLCDLVARTYDSNTNKTKFIYFQSIGNSLTQKSYFEINGDLLGIVCDLNGDGLPELVTYSTISSSSYVSAYQFNRATNRFDFQSKYYVSSKINKVEKGSFYGDGTQSLYIDQGNYVRVLSARKAIEEGGIPSPDPIEYLKLELSLSVPYANANEEKYFGDFNGDGITDLFGVDSNTSISFYLGTGVGLSSSSGFMSSISKTDFPDAANTLVADFDGDGIDDLMAYHSQLNVKSMEDLGYVALFKFVVFKGGKQFARGNSVWIEKTWNTRVFKYNVKPLFGDFDGDGTMDVLNVFYQDGNKTDLVKLCIGNKNYALNTVSDVNETLKIVYGYTTDGESTYISGSSVSFPYYKPRDAMMLVKSVEATSVETIKNTYSYEGFTIHLQGRGALGFEQVESLNESTGDLQRVKYKLNMYPVLMYPHISESILKEGAAEEILSQTTTNISVINLDYQRHHIYTSNIETTNLKKNITQNTTIVHDSNGNTELKTITVKDGSSVVYTFTEDPTYYKNISSAWIPGRPVSVSTAESRPGESTVNHDKSITYYSNGRIKDVILEPGHTKQLKTTYGYDQFGNINSVSINAANDPNIPQNLKTVTEAVTYTSDGRFPETMTDALGYQTVNQYNELTGAVSRHTDINSLQTFTTFDMMGGPLLTTGPDGHSAYQILNWVGSGDTDAPLGAYYLALSESSMSQVSKVYTDRAGRVLRTVVIKENETRSGSEKIIVDSEYNAQGLLVKQSMPHYLSQSAILNTTHTYDKYQRVETTNTPDGTIITYNYNDAQRSVTTTTMKGEISTSVTQTFNALGELIETINKDGSKVLYRYYSNGLLKQNGVEGNNTDIIMTYDLYGNKETVQTPNGGTATNVYNAFGQVVSTTDARSLKVEYEYDILGRIIKKLVQNGPTTTFTYDTQWKGSLSGASSTNNFSNSYTYDALGRQLSYTESIDGKSFTSSMLYDSDGRLSKYTYPSGFAIDYHYITNSAHLTGISYGSGIYVWRGGLQNQNMQYESYTLGSLTPVTYSYDNYARFTRKKMGACYDYNLSYDDKGNIDRRWENTYNNSESFVYDAQNRLKNIFTYHNGIKVDEHIYNYNNYSNIAETTGVDLQYAATQKNRVTSVTGDGLQMKYKNLSFDSENNLNQITNDDYELNFTYGFDKARRKSVLKQNSQIIKTRYYQNNYEELVESGKKIHYISSPTGLAAIYVMDNLGNNIYYTLTDHLGSINTLLSSSGSVVEEHAFDSWGSRRDPHNWGNASTATSAITDRGFTMHEHLDNFGLVHMNGRVYCPATMQFVSPDPYIQMPGNSANYNRYSYCLNNPISFTDPSGYKQVPFKELILTKNLRLINTGRPTGGRMGWNLGTIYNYSGGISYGGFSRSWSYNYETGRYYNSYTDESMSASAFNRSGIAQRMGRKAIRDVDYRVVENYRDLKYTNRNGSKYLVGVDIHYKLEFINVKGNSKDANGGGYISMPTRNGVAGPWAESVSDTGLSNNFIAGTAFSATTKLAKGGYNVINNEFIRQSRLNGLDDAPLKVSKGLKIIGKYGGYVFTAYSVYDVDAQWRSHQIGTAEMIIEQTSNGIGVIPVIGTSWGIGWNLGKSYGPSKWYGTDDTKWFK